MRPDEHKKKKNLEYKKKRGIAFNKEAKKEGQERDQQPRINRGAEENTDANKDGDVDPVEKISTTFSRRKISSNWDKYDHFESENDCTNKPQTRIGTDFATLVEAAGDSHSQFRFQDEKEWEDHAHDTRAVLEINFDDLSQSLQSLPLYKRLNLEEKKIKLHVHLQKEFVCSQTSKAKKSALELLSITQAGRQTDSIINNDVVMLTASTSNLRLNTKESNTTKSEEETEEKASLLHLSMKTLAKEKHLLVMNTTDSCQDSMESSKKTEKSDEDGSLDFLLSLDDPTVQRNSKKQPNIINESGISEATAACDNAFTEDSVQAKQTCKGPTDNSEENLEDWLESVLG